MRRPSIDGIAFEFPNKPSSNAPSSNSPRKLSLFFKGEAPTVGGTGVISIVFTPEPSKEADEATVNRFLGPLFKGVCAEANKCSAPQPVAEWLALIDPALRKYAHAFSDYGYKNVNVLLNSVYEHQLIELLELLGMEQSHRELILAAFARLEWSESNG
jgi:hypothetical protein